MRRKKLVVISLDALIAEDLAYLKTKPTFSMLLEGGARVERLKSVYPSLTYVCHTTMATGCYPDKHGVVNNTAVTLELDPPWLFSHENVKVKDVLDAAKAAGMTTASVGWPASGCHASVDYLVNECWPSKGAPIEEYKRAYLENGTAPALFDEVVAPILWMRVGRKQPDSSYFLTGISAEIIRRYQPDLLMLHQGNVDSCRHRFGVHSEEVKEALDECEEMVLTIIEATKDAGVFEDTDFIITADHGQLDAVRELRLNTRFVKEGLIEADETGRVKKALAWCQPSGMSAEIYLDDPESKALWDKVYAVLCEMRDERIGIAEVYTKKEFQAMHLDGDFSFIVEGDRETTFAADLFGSTVADFCGGDHGFHPDKGPRPPFIAYGPSIRQGVVLSEGDLIDGAPTYAKILGVELPDADGLPFSDLLKGERK